jgi:formate--tetrahydrofolate ligase
MTVTATHLAAELGLPADALVAWGPGAAKLDTAPAPIRGKLVLVSAITATGGGEGKTTISIGLVDALRAIGERASAVLRQPSLGPLFGKKGGGSGGGRATLVPAHRVDVHLTGDLHAVASAHNLLAATIDNHCHFGDDLDPRSITWPRAIDVNDRALRRIVVGIGDVERETGFVATAASEVMAVLGLARDARDLRARLARIVVGARRDGRPVTAGELGVVGAMMTLLADALLPNVVATAEGTPAFVHTGPFANIAHGCASVIAMRAALGLSDWVVTEAGFGFDLGGEKFFDIACRAGELDAAVVVIVCTTSSLVAHGGGELARGLANLEAHVAAARRFGKTPIVAVNRTAGDPSDALAAIVRFAGQLGVAAEVVDVFARGSDGAIALARAVIAHAARVAPVRYGYELADPPRAKLDAIATALYGARDVAWTDDASRELDAAIVLGAATWPVCVAKTPASLSDDPKRLGRPTDHTLTIHAVRPATGAGYWVALAGAITLMPGLPRHPRAEDIP